MILTAARQRFPFSPSVQRIRNRLLRRKAMYKKGCLKSMRQPFLYAVNPQREPQEEARGLLWEGEEALPWAPAWEAVSVLP